MSRRQVTDEDRQRVLYLRGQGLGYTLIARQTGLGRTTVVRIIGAADEPLPANEYDLDSQPVGPEEHRAVRRALGLASAEDLLALNTEADPFYCGTPAHLREAEWFGDLWRSLGFPDGAHPRRVYYKAGSVPGVTKPDGSPFEYGELSWRLITRASRHARNLGTVDAELIRDMRGRGIAENVMVPGAGSSAGEERHPSAMLAGSDGEEWDGWPLHQLWLPDPRWWRMPSPEVSGYGYDVADQPVLVEVWPEKSTMDDILGPLCRDLGVNLASGKGFESITHSLALLRRAEQYPSRRAVVLYISDHDKSGNQMPVSVARHLQFWAARLGIDAEVLVQPVVLTAGQVAHYSKLPQAPEEDGSTKTELDALEALYPGELARIVEAEVERWRDPGLEEALADAEEDAQQAAEDTWDDVSGDLAGELEQIRAEITAITEEYRPVIAEINRKLAAPRGKLAALKDRARELAAGTDFGLPDRPEPDDPEALDDRDEVLYDSERHWLDQLNAYREHQGKEPLDLDGGAS